MQARRGFLQMAGAAALTGASGLGAGGRLFAQDRYDQDGLLQFWATGNVTLMHISDVRAQVQPHYARAPQVHAGVGDRDGHTPYLTGEAFRIRYGIGGRAPMDYALTHEGFADLAQAYGKMGGLAHVATIVKAIRAERPGALLLDSGDSLNGSLMAREAGGQGMARVMAALGVDAMTLGAELDFGASALRAIARAAPFALLGQNVFDAKRHAPLPPIFPHRVFEQNGVPIAVIGQALPHWQGPGAGALRLAVREKNLQQIVEDLRASGIGLVVVLSQNGLDADRKLARRVAGIDVILSGRSHDALPEPMRVGQTHVIASGGQGRFLSRLDLDVQDGAVRAVEHRLIPIFSEIISADQGLDALIRARQARFADASGTVLGTVLGTAAALLYRRGTVQSTWDDVICTALMAQLEADVAVAPAARWGRTILPGGPITQADLASVTAGADQGVSTATLSGAALKTLLEDAAEAAFHADPYQRSATDMMRTGGLSYRVAINGAKGQRISALALVRTGALIAQRASYTVAGWGGALAGSRAGDIADVLTRHISQRGQVGAADPGHVAVSR